MKKVLFLVFLVVESWLSVSAQFGGFSQNGNFQLFRVYLDPWNHYNLINSLGVSKSEEYNNPVYIPGAKSVIKSRQQIYYDRTEDSWYYGRQVVSYKIYFDSVGRVVKSCRLAFDGVTESDYYVFTYANSLLKKILKEDIMNEYPIFSFYYDSAGVLKRVINDNNEWHLSYQFGDSIIYIREFVNGNEMKPSPIVFNISQYGKVLTYSNEYTNDSIKWIRDEHGFTTMYCSYDKTDTIPDVIYFENEYDKDGNIISRLEYEMKDVGKWYKRGYVFDYEYDFDE